MYFGTTLPFKSVTSSCTLPRVVQTNPGSCFFADATFIWRKNGGLYISIRFPDGFTVTLTRCSLNSKDHSSNRISVLHLPFHKKGVLQASLSGLPFQRVFESGHHGNAGRSVASMRELAESVMNASLRCASPS